MVVEGFSSKQRANLIFFYFYLHWNLANYYEIKKVRDSSVCLLVMWDALLRFFFIFPQQECLKEAREREITNPTLMLVCVCHFT